MAPEILTNMFTYFLFKQSTARRDHPFVFIKKSRHAIFISIALHTIQTVLKTALQCKKENDDSLMQQNCSSIVK